MFFAPSQTRLHRISQPVPSTKVETKTLISNMRSLCGFTKMNGKHADMEVIVKSNDFPREETQSFSRTQ
jgi:hypothetical protein